MYAIRSYYGRNVFISGLVSFFMDISSEMIYPLIPLFLSNVLGVNKSVIGLIEGIAESTASVLRVFSGWFSDKIGTRITSYNVCYTKLLRRGGRAPSNGKRRRLLRTRILKRSLWSPGVHTVSERNPSMINEHTVITSYSIHYTKLYERLTARK